MSTPHAEDCLEIVRKHRDEIERRIRTFAAMKQLEIVDILVYKSRVAGTCRPSSDIDIYVQLDEKHASLVGREGDVWGDRKGLALSREMREKGLVKVGTVEVDGKPHDIDLDVRAGIGPDPPLNQKKYSELMARGVPYSIRLEEV